MKPHHFLVRLLVVVLGASPFGCFAAEAAKAAGSAKAATTPAKTATATNPTEAPINAPAKPAPQVKGPDNAKLRETISKSLGFLAKEGDEWMAAKSCNSCHHLPVLLWSHHDAKQRGFPVDQEKFDEWLFWANESAAGKNSGGIEVLAYLILAVPEHPASVLTKRIADEQKSATKLTPASQIPASQAPGMQMAANPDPAVVAMRTLLIALASAPSPQPEPEAARIKAAAEFKKMDPAKRMDTLVFSTLYARHFGMSKEAAAFCAQILKLQRGDGGWSEIIGANQSDPLATGQALYALQLSADPKAADAIARAQLWLVGLQRDNGSWPIDYSHISKTDRSDPKKASSVKNVTEIYTFWGSAWATIGLLQAFPETDGSKANTAEASAKP